MPILFHKPASLLYTDISLTLNENSLNLVLSNFIKIKTMLVSDVSNAQCNDNFKTEFTGMEFMTVNGLSTSHPNVGDRNYCLELCKLDSNCLSITYHYVHKT